MKKQEFNKRTGSNLASGKFAIVNSVQKLRSSSRIKWLPDVVSLYQKGGMGLLEIVERKLLAIRKNRDETAVLSRKANTALGELKGLIG